MVIMSSQEESPDFALPCFKAYVSEIDEEYQSHVESMMIETYEGLSKSEKLMLKPLIEIHKFKKQIDSLKASDTQDKDQMLSLEKKIKSRLDVINENGDIHVLIKKFNISLLDSHKKKSAKAIAKLAAESILKFVEFLKATGELRIH